VVENDFLFLKVKGNMAMFSGKIRTKNKQKNKTKQRTNKNPAQDFGKLKTHMRAFHISAEADSRPWDIQSECIEAVPARKRIWIVSIMIIIMTTTYLDSPGPQ
jgi:hypothetical protein